MQTTSSNALAYAMGAVLLFAAHTTTRAALPTYQCTLLQPSASGGQVIPRAADKRAVIYGATEYVGKPGSRATKWASLGQPTALREPSSSTGSEVLGIHDGGYWVGHVKDELGVAQPVIWKKGAPSYLPLLSNTAVRGMAHAVNLGGHAVGFNDLTAPEYHAQAVLWRDGQIFRLPGLGSNDVVASSALGINKAGLMVGWSQRAPDGDAVPVRWTLDRVAHPLSLLPGHTGGMAMGVNDSRIIVGETHSYDTSPPSTRAVAWRDKETLDMGALPGHLNSAAAAVDSVGHVVGWSESPEGDMRAVWWPSWAGAPLDLNTRLDTKGCRDASNQPVVLNWAVALGELGAIAAVGRSGNAYLGFMLKPI